jgi:hypothetical protein
MREAAGYYTHLNLVLFGGIEGPRPGAQRRYRDANGLAMGEASYEQAQE